MTSVAFILVGGILCLLLVKGVRGSRYLAVILLASYSLRVALTLGFYLVSAYEVPIFQSLQLPGGFWRFTYDAPSYHVNGARIAQALRLGTELPQIMVGDQPFLVDNYDFFYFVGLVYWAFGTHPLHVPLLNSMFWTAMALLGYTLARRIKGEKAGGFAAALISFWPSGFVWSSQILKDTLVIFLLLLSFYLVIQIWEEKVRVALPAAVVLMPGFFLLARVRFYLGAALILAVVVSLWLTLVVRFRELRWESLVRALALIGLLWVPFLTARSVDPLRLLSPARPELVAAKPLVATPDAAKPPEAKSVEGPAPAANPFDPYRQVVTQVIQRSVDLTLQIYNIRGEIETRRSGYASTGGPSSFETDVQLRNFRDMVAFLPRGLAYALYGPFPWEWFSLGGDTGMFKAFSGIETLLMVAMTPFLLVGMLRAVRSGRMAAWTLLLFGTITIVSLALTVANLGILFRLRLQGLIPLLILVSAFGLPADRVRRLFAHRHSPP